MRDLEPEPTFSGSWVQPTPRRAVGRVVLVLASVGALVGLVLLLTVQTFEALAVLVAFTNIALLTYLALSSSTPTTVTLEGPRLRVTCGRQTDEFDLSGPMRRVSTVGFPNRPNWLVHLETIEGTIVELGPTQVDPQVMHAAIAHYRPPTIPAQRTGTDQPGMTVTPKEPTSGRTGPDQG